MWSITTHLSDEVAALEQRVRVLRDGRLTPDAALEAALAELETCEEELRTLVEHALPTQVGHPGDGWAHVLRQLTVPALVTDGVGSVRGLTGAAAQLLGLPPRVAAGKPLFAYVELGHRAVARAALRSVSGTGVATALQCRLVPRAADPVEVAMHLSQLPDQSILWVAVPAAQDGETAAGLALAAALPGLMAGGDLAAAAQRAASVVAELLPGSPEVGVLGWDADHASLQQLGFTSAGAGALDLLQSAAGGPATVAARTRSVVAVHALEQLAEWPDLAEHAHASGVRGLLALPACVDGEVVAVVTAYSREPLAPLAGVLPQLLGEAVGRSLQAARAEQDGVRLVAQLREALSSRAVIDQAKGIVMAQRGCSAEEAFEVLSKVSQNRNIRLRVLAEQLVASVANGASV